MHGVSQAYLRTSGSSTSPWDDGNDLLSLQNFVQCS
ncbi:hypothetical protein DAI22_01g121350 [Oryza sativa Japonica Group]|nr:hypothetical protein DAI22_01g121350 [Oryza sativa Japonica Group]